MKLNNHVARLSVFTALTLASTLASPQIHTAQPIILSTTDNAMLGWKDWALIAIAAISVDGIVDPKQYKMLLACREANEMSAEADEMCPYSPHALAALFIRRHRNKLTMQRPPWEAVFLSDDTVLRLDRDKGPVHW